METLSLEKFNPKKSELTELAEKYRSLEIKGIEDVEGYKQVDEARKILKKQRVDVEKQGKEFRAEAIKFQKDVIAYEKEIVAIIEPLEDELSAKQDVIDLEKHKIKMSALLPDRKERLATIEVTAEDDLILSMTSEDFEQFYNEKKTEYLNAKEAKLKETQDKLDKEKRDREIAEQARLEAEEKAKREIELAKKNIKPSKKQIVVLNRGWVVVGDYSEKGDECTLSDASIIRKWGTTNGLGELAEKGKLEDTVLDSCPNVHFHKMTMVARMDCNEEKWR